LAILSADVSDGKEEYFKAGQLGLFFNRVLRTKFRASVAMMRSFKAAGADGAKYA